MYSSSWFVIIFKVKESCWSVHSLIGFCLFLVLSGSTTHLILTLVGQGVRIWAGCSSTGQNNVMWWEFRTECVVTFHRDSVSVLWLVCGCRLFMDFLFCNCFCLSHAVAGDWKKKKKGQKSLIARQWLYQIPHTDTSQHFVHILVAEMLERDEVLFSFSFYYLWVNSFLQIQNRLGDILDQ